MNKLIRWANSFDKNGSPKWSAWHITKDLNTTLCGQGVRSFTEIESDTEKLTCQHCRKKLKNNG